MTDVMNPPTESPAFEETPLGSRVVVVGCGHVGLVMAAGLARLGHAVVAVDKDPDIVAELCAGKVHFFEPELDQLVGEGLASGRLTFTTAYDHGVPSADFIFLAVDTPTTPVGAADLRNVRSAARSIAAALDGTSPIIVNKSTSPMGTGETIEGILAERLAERGQTPRIVSNPEFLRQGRAVWDFFNPDRIVVGSRSREDAEAVAGLFSALGTPVVLTDVRTAEMIKYVANSFLATRISFINEVARLCEPLGVSIDQVIEGVGLDPRIGPDFLNPGIGFGGSCFPKDIAALRYAGEVVGVATPILSAVQAINQGQKVLAVRRLRTWLGSLEGKRVAVWGITFKGGTDDLRDSPAVDVVGLLFNEGASVAIYDPSFPHGAPNRIAEAYAPTPIAAAVGADAVAVLTDWPEFRDVNLADVRAVMRGSVMFDGRNLLSREEAETAGFAYHGVGRAGHSPRRRRSDV